MRQTQTWIFTAIMMSSIFSGCGNDDPLKASKVGESDIWRSYSVEYNQGNRLATILAKFSRTSATGRALSLDGDSAIAVEDSAMRLNGVAPKLVSQGVGGYSWFLTAANDVKSVDFLWTTPAKRLVRDHLVIPVPPGIVVMESRLRKSYGGQVVLDRDVAEAGETVIVSLTGALEGVGTPVTVTQTVTSGRYAMFTSTDLSRCAAGSVSVSVVVERVSSGKGSAGDGILSGSMVGITKGLEVQLQLFD